MICALQSIIQSGGGISRGAVINILANAYRLRVVGDRAENIETSIKHGMTALRGMEELPFLKPKTSFSTYRFLLVQPFCAALCRLIPSQRGAGQGYGYPIANATPKGVSCPSRKVDSEGSSR
jgi:hypothetical protein